LLSFHVSLLSNNQIGSYKILQRWVLIIWQNFVGYIVGVILVYDLVLFLV